MIMIPATASMSTEGLLLSENAACFCAAKIHIFKSRAYDVDNFVDKKTKKKFA